MIDAEKLAAAHQELKDAYLNGTEEEIQAAAVALAEVLKPGPPSEAEMQKARDDMLAAKDLIANAIEAKESAFHPEEKEAAQQAFIEAHEIATAATDAIQELRARDRANRDTNIGIGGDAVRVPEAPTPEGGE